MTMEEFIKRYQFAIDHKIAGKKLRKKDVSYKERELWVMNNEELYKLAIKAGVNVYE